MEFLDYTFTVHQVIGYLGGILLALCGLPEMLRSIKDKKCHVGAGMLTMWGIGEIFLILYVLPSKDIPLLLNYGVNCAIILVMVYYKLFGSKK